MKQKGISAIILILIVALGALGFFGYKYFLKMKLPVANPSPTPTFEPGLEPEPVTDSWKTYTNSVDKFSFKYPSDWVIDTKGEKGDDNGENISVKLTKGNAKIQISANMVGIGGVGQDYQGVPVQIDGNSLYKYTVLGGDGKTTITGFTDTLKESLGIFQISGKTYSISLSYPATSVESKSFEEDFSLLVSTFKFSAQSSGLGTVSEKLCYPSDFLPPGEIAAKEISSKKIYTQEYAGSMAGGKFTYSFELPAGTYHLRFQAHGSTTKPDIFTSGYYNECAKTMHTDQCTPDSGHILINVDVKAGKEVKNIDLCDFYGSQSQQEFMDKSF